MPATRGMVVAAIAAAVGALSLAIAPATASAEKRARDGDVYAQVTGSEVVLGNDLVERRWQRDGLITTAMVDKRAGGASWARGHRDFALGLVATEVGSERFRVRDARIDSLERGGLRVTMTLVPGPDL